MKQFHIGLTDSLILCGGVGSRLKSVVSDRPKILAEINGVPFIEYLLNYLEINGLKRVTLCTGYRHDQIEKWVSSSYQGNLLISFSIEQKPLGTAGAVYNARNQIKSDDFFVINGDTFFNIKFSKLLELFYSHESLGLLSLVEINSIKGYGTVTIDKQNKINSFTEKSNKEQSSNYINAGIYVFNNNIFKLIEPNNCTSMEYDLLPLLINQFPDKIFGYPFKGEFIDIGTPNNYKKSENFFSKFRSKSF